MSDFITLTCPSCGGKLKITQDIQRFACAHCGTEHLVRRGDGIVSLSPVLEEVRGVRKATDLTASELAIARIKAEIDELRNYRDSITVDSSKDEASVFFTISTIAIGIGVFWGLVNLDQGYCLIPILLGIFGFIVTNSHYSKKHRIEEKEKKDEVNIIISQKKMELRKHQDIVNRG